VTDEIVFVRTRHEYASYADLWRLVELTGFPLIYPDEVPTQAPDTTFIITPANGEWRDWPEDHTTGHIVFWNLEWGKGDPIPCANEVWTSDAWHAERIGARFVPFGSHPDLCPTERADAPDYDAILLAYRNWPRQVAEGALIDAGLTVAPDGWGEHRRDMLGRTRCMVNVHQHQIMPEHWIEEEYPCVAAQRFAVAASARIPLIGQTMYNPLPFIPGLHFIPTAMPFIANVVASLTPQRGEELARAMHLLLCEQLRFDKVVKAAVRGGVEV